jgi:hypothetical protein
MRTSFARSHPVPRRLPDVRSNRGLWFWLSGLLLALWLFLLAIAIAYFVKEPGYSLFGNGWMVCSCLAFVAAFGVLFNLTRSTTEQPPSKPNFPDITLEITSVGTLETERESSSGLDVPARLHSYNVRMANLEESADARLTVRMYVKLIAGSWGRADEAVCPQPSWVLPPALGLHPLAMPVVLRPGESVAGQLVYEIPGYYAGKLAEPLTARLEIADDRSGKTMTIPAALGLFDVSVMTRVSGGVELVSPRAMAENGGPAVQAGVEPEPGEASITRIRPA